MTKRKVRLGAAIAPLFSLVGVSMTGVGCQAGAEFETSVATVDERIVGGTAAPGLANPWMARIDWQEHPTDGSAPYWRFACGGSLIARDWILTAAHCVATIDDQVLVKQPNADVRVIMGDYLLDVDESTEQVRAVDNVIVHPGYVYVEEPGYGSVKEFNDIALLHLATPVTLNDFARVIKLASENDGTGREASLSGWGEDEPGLGKISSDPTLQLKQLSASVVDPTNASDPAGGCSAAMLLERMGGVPGQRAVDAKTEICTLSESGPEDYQSACYWDSGSPWVTSVSGCAEQIGVHTFGDYFCVSYDIATRVSAYLPWIREQGVDYTGDRVYEAETMFHATGGSHPEGWNIWDNNYVSFEHTFNGGQQQMVVRAAGVNANGWPRMRVSVGGATVYEANVTTTGWANHGFTFSAPYGSREVQIRFLNDYYQGGLDRNLFIDKATVKDARTSCGYLDTIVPTLRITNDWGSGYCAAIDIENTIGLNTTTWTVVYDTKDSSLYDSWNPRVNNGQGQHTAIPSNNAADTWLRVIPPGETRTLGFCANRVANTTTLPEVVSAHATY